MRTHERSFVVLACAAVVIIASARSGAQSGRLAVERQGDRLRLSAPQAHFLEGVTLERLRNGAAVTYVFTATVETGPGGRSSHVEERFVVSYDLWEEKFSVVQPGPPHRSASHLSAAAAEAWCLDNLLLRVPALPPDRTFVVKLRAAVAEDDPQPRDGFTLSALIDVLSRKRADAPAHWELLSAPLRLMDMGEKARR